MQTKERARRVKLRARELKDNSTRHRADRGVARRALEKERNFTKHRAWANGAHDRRLGLLKVVLGEAHFLSHKRFGFPSAMNGRRERGTATGREHLEDALDNDVHILRAFIALEHEQLAGGDDDAAHLICNVAEDGPRQQVC